MNPHRFTQTITRHRFWVVWAAALVACILWNDQSLRRHSDWRDRPYLWGWDNNAYFAWGRSLALDGDIDFRNDFEYVAGLRGFSATSQAYARYLHLSPPTPTGRVANKYGMGLGVLSLPALYAARAASAAYTQLTGRPVSPFAAVYLLAFIASSIFWGFVGLAVAWRIMRPLYGPRIALWSLAVGFFGLSLGDYIVYEPTMAHAAGFGFTTLFAALALRWRMRLDRAVRGDSGSSVIPSALGMGFVLGVACMIRYTNIAFALAPVVLAAVSLARSAAADRPRFARPVALSLALAAPAFAAGFFPQMLAWKILYGSWLTNSYRGEVHHLLPVHALHILFGLRNSLFVWTPLALAAVAGLWLAARRGVELALAGLAVLLATTWIYGGWQAYWLGSSYGMRGFVECSLFFMLGLAELICRAERRFASRPWPRRLVFASLIALVAWNLFFLNCYRAKIQPHDKPLRLRALVTNWPRWRRQFKKDYDLIERAQTRKFPLFTQDAPTAK